MLAAALENLAAFVLVSMFSIFIFPAVIERIVYIIPQLAKCAAKKEVIKKSVPITVWEVIVWLLITAAVYFVLYLFGSNYFYMATSSWPAIIAWLCGAINLTYRFVNFDRIIRHNFYLNIYMNYITPDTRQKFEEFADELNTMYLQDIERVMQEDLPYLYRDAVIKKKRQLSS